MQLWPGTSGFSYPQWKGPFYPSDLAGSRMLGFYSQKLPTVEINNTFYRMPKAEVLERWVTEVPEGFRFSLKASRRITHKERLKDSQSSMDYFWKNAQSLGGRLGPVLFQLPPFLRCDTDRLSQFLGHLPGGIRAAFEFRHASWNDQAVYDCLAEHGCALCIADTDEGDDPDMVSTADWGYLRLRREAYTDEDLERWSSMIARQSWTDVYVYFKHEDDGAAPAMAERMSKAFERARGAA